MIEKLTIRINPKDSVSVGRVHCPVLLPKLLARYNDTICKTLPGGVPLLMDFLTTRSHDGSDLLMGGLNLDSKVAETGEVA